MDDESIHEPSLAGLLGTEDQNDQQIPKEPGEEHKKVERWDDILLGRELAGVTRFSNIQIRDVSEVKVVVIIVAIIVVGWFASVFHC